MIHIAEYIEGLDFNSFKKDYKTLDAVIWNFEVIGKAAKNIPIEIKNHNSDIPWNEMYLLRNKVTHEYFGVDYEIIWDIATDYLPENKKQIDQILKNKENKKE